jgi:hypothetical protein
MQVLQDEEKNAHHLSKRLPLQPVSFHESPPVYNPMADSPNTPTSRDSLIMWMAVKLARNLLLGQKTTWTLVKLVLETPKSV